MISIVGDEGNLPEHGDEKILYERTKMLRMGGEMSLPLIDVIPERIREMVAPSKVKRL